MPLSTAPSLTPEELVLLLGALWGARLGRNRHLVGATGDTQTRDVKAGIKRRRAGGGGSY